MAQWVDDPYSEAYKRHLARLPDYYWVAEDGLKLQVLNIIYREMVFAIMNMQPSYILFEKIE